MISIFEESTLPHDALLRSGLSLCADTDERGHLYDDCGHRNDTTAKVSAFPRIAVRIRSEPCPRSVGLRTLCLDLFSGSTSLSLRTIFISLHICEGVGVTPIEVMVRDCPLISSA